MSLRDAILDSDPHLVVSEHVLERVPFVFAENWPSFRSWRKELGSRLGVDPREISITGSASVGFSLNPAKNLKPFDSKSDIDVAVVSEWHFSEGWHALRNIDATFAMLTPAQREAVKEHQKRYVYWGCIATDRILPLLPYAISWMEGLTYMSSVVPTEGRTINARIYKDFRALSSYQARSVASLRAELFSKL